VPGGQGPGAAGEEMEDCFCGRRWRGKCEGEFLVDGGRFNLLEAESIHTVQREDLSEEGEEVDPEAGRCHPWEDTLEAKSNPVGQVESWAVTSPQEMAGLLGQHGLGPCLRAGEAKSTGCSLGVALFKGQSPEPARPQEIRGQAS
jgi:hypothetical protein